MTLNSIYRRVIEDHDTVDVDGTNIKLVGPLADVYRKALDIALAKKEVDETGAEPIIQPATESQAQDAQSMEKLLAAIANNSVRLEPTKPPQVLYGVPMTDVTPSTIIDVSQNLMDSPTPEAVNVIVDTTVVKDPEDTETSNNEILLPVMEKLVTRLGGRFYRSLEAYVDSLG